MLKISPGRSIYTTRIDKGSKSGLFKNLSQSWLLNQQIIACIPEINSGWSYSIFIITGFYF